VKWSLEFRVLVLSFAFCTLAPLRMKLSVSKFFWKNTVQSGTLTKPNHRNHHRLSTRCGRTTVERVVNHLTAISPSDAFQTVSIYHTNMKRQHEGEARQGGSSPKRASEAPEVIRGDRPIYRFFLIWKDGQGSTREVPARCLLDWGSTSFAISKRFVSALNIPTIERAQAIPSYDASG
jgi:hypothetical protein